MDFLEKDLELVIFETPNKELCKRGFDIRGKKFRQVRVGNYGIADLITIERLPNFDTFRVTVYEFKKDAIGTDTLMQGLRYVRGVQRYMDNRFEDVIIEMNLVLVGKSVNTSENFVYLEQYWEGFSFYTYQYKFDGIHFSIMHGYSLINEGF